MHQVGWEGAAHIGVHLLEEHILHVEMGPPMCTPARSCPSWAHMCMGVSKSSCMHLSPDTWRGQFAGNYAVGPGASQSALSGEAEEEETRWKPGLGHQV